MWNLLKRSKQECRRLGGAVEQAAASQAGAASVENLTEALAAEDRKHIETCQDCQQAVQEVVRAKKLFQSAASFSREERPWFAARVMAAIAARERELAESVTAWTEFPRFASRLTWVVAIVLLAGTTWFYESVLRAPAHPVSGLQEYLFETPQQAAPDDILTSRAGDRP